MRLNSIFFYPLCLPLCFGFAQHPGGGSTKKGFSLIERNSNRHNLLPPRQAEVEAREGRGGVLFYKSSHLYTFKNIFFRYIKYKVNNTRTRAPIASNTSCHSSGVGA